MSARFITSKARIEQTDIPGYWKTIDNELFLDSDSQLYLTPRYLYSDGFTYPKIIMAILGDKHYLDVRCAHGHDLFCRFHQRIRVNKSLTVLKMEGYLRTHIDNKGNSLVVCEDIPIEYLEVETISKKWADDCFKRMLLSCNVSQKQANILRIGVIFNLNWYLKTGKKSILEYDIYNEDIGLVNGV